MKNYIKKHITEVILAFGFSFMLYFYEPLFLYSYNTTEFWFDIYLYFKYVLIEFIIMYFVILLILLLINKITKDNYKVKSIIFMIYIYIYIEGNYLIGTLPKIDGVEVKPLYDEWLRGNITSAIAIILAYLGVKYLIKEKTIKNLNKYIKYTVIVISLMLSAATASFFFKPHFFDKKENVSATNKNLNTYSNNKNFIIFVADTVDATRFYEIVDNNKLFKDFTGYKDTTSAYLYTRYSIPFLLSGTYYENQEDFVNFYTRILDDSKVLNRLKNEKYIVDLYEPGIINNGESYKNVDNIKSTNRFNLFNFIKVETKYALYKYSPYGFKYFANITTLNFNSIKEDEYYNYENDSFYKKLDDKIEKTDNNMFKFIHIEGGHGPYRYDKDVNLINNGTYEDSLKATITIIDKYINKLKENNVYDNSIIIITADHGHSDEVTIGRSNPILYIKGINEKHDYIDSKDKVSFMDLVNGYYKLLDGASGNALFNEVQPNDKRRLLAYVFEVDGEIYEYFQEGNAWNVDTIKPSGKSYRKK